VDGRHLGVLDHEAGPVVLMQPSALRAGRAARAVAGFTLLELVVTVALLGLLVTLSFPSFSSWIRNSQTRTATEALQTGLRTAQGEALRRNRRVVLFFTNDNPAKNFDLTSHPETDAAPAANGKNWALQTAPDTWGDAQYITGGALADVASTVAFSGGPSAICFNSNGRLVDAAAGSSGSAVTGLSGASCSVGTGPTTINVGQATARSGDRSLRVVVQIGGQIRMCDPNRPTLSSTSPEGCP
jgi:type IV fimbrial biogenesis protein FimT